MYPVSHGKAIAFLSKMPIFLDIPCMDDLHKKTGILFEKTLTSFE